MLRCLQKVVLPVIIYCCCLISLPALSKDLADSTALPASVTAQLQQFRQEDKLNEWIYARIDYVDKAPFERIGFLMATQQEAWRSYQTHSEREAWFNLLILQGYYQLQTGNILASINAYEGAMEFYDAYPLPPAFTDEYMDFVLKPLGNNYTRLADYHTALYIHQKTLALAIQKKDQAAEAAAWSNMAICARWKDDLVTAAQYCKEGINRVNRRTPLYGLLLSTWAEILTEQQRYDSAAFVCAASLKQLQPFVQRSSAEEQPLYWYTSGLQTAARIALQQSQFEQAITYANQALQLFNKHFPTAKQREKAKVNVLLGDILLQSGSFSASTLHYQQALLLLLPNWAPANLTDLPPPELLYSENTLTDALAGKAAVLERLQHNEAALSHYFAIFNAARKLRAAFFHTDSKLKDLQLLRSRANAAMKVAYLLWSTSKQDQYRDQLLLIAELSKAQVLLEEREARSRKTVLSPADSLAVQAKRLQVAITYYQYEWLMAKDKFKLKTLLEAATYELSLLNKKIKQRPGMLYQEQILDMEQLQRMMSAIPDRTVVLEFFEGADSSYIIELTRSGIQSVRTAPGAQSLRSSIQSFMQRWFAGGPAAMMNAPAGFYQECAALYKSIFSAYTWKEGHHYLLVPDGVFNYLPFDALLTSDRYSADIRQWPFLCKKVSLSQAYSLQTWYGQQSTVYPDGRFAAFFVSRGTNAQQALPAVEKEQAILQQTVKGSYYVNAAATWQVFNRLADSLSVVHIGTHAVSSANDPFPYLQLYDRPFYLFDLRYKNFSPSLVVLGACKTADGALLEGEGVNSLGRGFAAAGAGGVVSGLWNVNDEAGAGIMKLFYEQLASQQDPGMALHLAKQQWLQLHGENTILQLPYYWAGFIYSGRIAPVALAGRSLKKVYYMGALLLVLVGAGVIVIRKRSSRKK